MSLTTPFRGPTPRAFDTEPVMPKPRRTHADFDERTSRRTGPKRREFTSFEGAFHRHRPSQVFMPDDPQPASPQFWDAHCRTPPVRSDADPV